MMKTMKNACGAAALAAVIATPAFAGAGSTDTVDLDAAFGGNAPMLASLDAQAMEETRGRLAPLTLALSIAAVDLGLSAFFWGVYVPLYTSGGACTGCYSVVQQP